MNNKVDFALLVFGVVPGIYISLFFRHRIAPYLSNTDGDSDPTKRFIGMIGGCIGLLIAGIMAATVPQFAFWAIWLTPLVSLAATPIIFAALILATRLICAGANLLLAGIVPGKKKPPIDGGPSNGAW